MALQIDHFVDRHFEGPTEVKLNICERLITSQLMPNSSFTLLIVYSCHFVSFNISYVCALNVYMYCLMLW